MQALTAKVAFQFSMVLAGPHLPSLISLVSAMPAYEYMFASSTPHKLDGSNEAWHRISIRNRQ